MLNFVMMEENPIDKDKVTENPGTLPYAHHIGGVAIKPEDKGKIKGRALAAMEEQTNSQLSQLKEQMQVLANQAKAIQDRIEISEYIYTAKMGFEPLIGHLYYLYVNRNEEHTLSLVAPEEWGRTSPYTYIATVKLLADHTWEVVEKP
jgi:hypothetical protein